MGKPERLVLIAGGAVFVVVVVAVAVILALGDPDRVSVDPASPEGVVQRYLDAVRRGDEADGRRLLSERAREQIDDDPGWWRYQSSSTIDTRLITLQRTDITGERANVHLRIENSGSSGPFIDRYSRTLMVPLVFENGVWLIDDPYVALY